jgi:hypothetical protein
MAHCRMFYQPFEPFSTFCGTRWTGGGVRDWRGGVNLTLGLHLHRSAQHRKTRTPIHASSGIRTHDPSVQVVKTHAWARGRWDRLDPLSYLNGISVCYDQSHLLGVYACVDMSKQLGVWVTSQFSEIDNDCTSHSKRN